MKRHVNKSLVLISFATLLAGSFYLVLQREGLLAWSSLLLSTIGLVFALALPVRKALVGLVLVVGLNAVSWGGALYYVFSTWESGEVVEIQLADDLSFRTWVVENDGYEVVIYDCPPDRQALVESKLTVLLTRNGEQYSANIEAVAVNLDSKILNDVYALYEAKYASQGMATQLYYLLIGPRRGSQLYVLRFAR